MHLASSLYHPIVQSLRPSSDVDFLVCGGLSSPVCGGEKVEKIGEKVGNGGVAVKNQQ